MKKSVLGNYKHLADALEKRADKCHADSVLLEARADVLYQVVNLLRTAGDPLAKKEGGK